VIQLKLKTGVVLKLGNKIIVSVYRHVWSEATMKMIESKAEIGRTPHGLRYFAAQPGTILLLLVVPWRL
jgi:hypothetical protein